MKKFSDWFASIMKDQSPFPYQERLATAPELPLLLDAPTGAGKTAAAVLAWMWRRCEADAAIRAKTPRRLVYCLPVRTLVEQTEAAVQKWVEKANLTEKVAVHLLMGGAVSQRWEAHPEDNIILIGTQDQLLSRALNRGYAMSRYKWAIHFALLNNDCLWVMDETQLMGAGLQTTAQLQGFRESFQTWGAVQSLWMSATLDETALGTIDYKPDLNKKLSLNEEDGKFLQKRLTATKRLVKAETVLAGKEEEYAKALAKEVAAAHAPGTLTLVIVNRVTRAQAVYKALEKLGKDKPLDKPRLIHSRFRVEERKELNKWLRGEKLSGIAVATQAIEAGVDISAKCLFTEIAPWASLVQRFGRCNRYGENAEATVCWIDIDLKKRGAALPYNDGELETARELLAPLQDVGLESLKQVKAPQQERAGVIPRKHDILQLFDTTADLAGHDIDVSPFIREAENNDIAIAWRIFEKEPQDMGALRDEELCRVSIGRAKEFLKERKAWVWDGLEGKWMPAKEIYPGMSLLLPCEAGGYSEILGFTGNAADKPAPTSDKLIKADKSAPTSGKLIKADGDASDWLSYNFKEYVSLKQHAQDVAEEAKKLCEALGGELPGELLERAARWHDLGKAHAEFQEMLTGGKQEKKEEDLWAKSDGSARISNERRGFRHELVSALVALQEGEEFLLAYLVAAHHGKVRMTIQPRPTEKPPEGGKRFALGVWEGDEVPAVDLGDKLTIPAQRISLACMELGEKEAGESWAARAIALLDKYGPFRLAYLEAIVRIADWRGSQRRAGKGIFEESDS